LSPLFVQADGYDPRKSKVSDDRMEVWRKEAVSGNLIDVPGIGPAAISKLAESDDQITNTYQLFGKYLMLKGPDTEDHTVECIEHSEKFWHYLKSLGISAHRSAIVKAIAEKAAGFFPGIYDANMYDDDDEDDM
jgi:hypothetical protein